MDRLDDGRFPLKPGLLRATSPAATAFPESSKSPLFPVFKGLGSGPKLKEPAASGSRLPLTVSFLWLLWAVMNSVPLCRRKSLCGVSHTLWNKISLELKANIKLSTFWSTSTSIKGELDVCVCVCISVKKQRRDWLGAERISNKTI